MDTSGLDAMLAHHLPADGTEADHTASVRALLASSADPTSRHQFDPGHVTASAFVLSPDASQVLLILHGKLDLWLQPGGHVDPEDTDIVAAAIREVREETGLQDVRPVLGFPDLLDVDVHDIPANPRKGEPAHQHFDVRVLLRAVAWEHAAGSDAKDARWVPLDAVGELATDASVLRAMDRIRMWRAAIDATELRYSPAAERNRGPILEVLRSWLPEGGDLLELASGTGQHAVWCGEHLPRWRWQPSDVSSGALACVEARVRREGPANVLPPVRLDVRSGQWHVPSMDAVYCANLVHISPWSATLGMLAGAGRQLRPGGQLIVYGPYRVDGAHTSPSNAAFDADLRARNPEWGVRDLEAVIEAAAGHGLAWLETREMPANNLMLRFVRSAGSSDAT